MKKYGLILDRNAGIEERLLAVEVSHLIGFCSPVLPVPFLHRPDEAPEPETVYLQIGAKGPDAPNVIRVPEGKSPGEVWKQLAVDLLPKSGKEIPGPADYSSALAHAPKSTARKTGGLELLFEKGWLLQDEDGDGLPDRLDCSFYFETEPDDALCQAACILAARFGMETTSAACPLISRQPRGNLLVFRRAERAPALELEKTVPEKRILLTGSGQELVRFAEALGRQFPLAAEGERLCHVTEHLRRSLRLRRADGQAAWILSHGADEVCLCPDGDLTRFQARFPDTVFHTRRDPILEERRSWSLKGEEQELRELMQRVYPLLRPGDRVSVVGAIGQDRPERLALLDEIRDRVQSAGAVLTEGRLRCAFKQGLSWLEEEFAPKAAALGSVSRVRIRFSPWIHRCVTEHGAEFDWQSLDRNTEKPPRWLSDLYPADELAAQVLGISRDNVILEAGELPPTVTYEASACDAAGKRLLREECSVHTCAAPFLYQLPDCGPALPCTGFLKVCVNETAVLNQRIATDAERIWTRFQEELLPWVGQKAAEAAFSPLRQPFFTRLELQIGIGGPERELPQRSDHISAGEVLEDALHQVGQAYFLQMGKKHGVKGLDAPGLILPRIHVRPGPPTLEASLWMPCEKGDCFAPAETECVCAGVGWEKERLTLRFLLLGSAVDSALVRELVRLTDEGFTDLSRKLAGWGAVGLEQKGECLWAKLPEPPEALPDLGIQEIDLWPDHPVGYEEYRRVMRQLSRVPGLRVTVAGRSYQGREIYAVEPAAREIGWVSRVKRTQLLPTVLINGRHHANEVSATNAIFHLIRELFTNPEYRTISEEMNLILLPMENVDGAALHEELCREHPTWQHQTCYTNSLGADLMPYYFDHDTIHTEALAFTRIAEEWLPDAFLDLHGVPHHEIPQQFGQLSGYRGLWLPRALLCAFYFHIDDPDYPSNTAFCRAWRSRIDRAFEGCRDFARDTEEWNGRFMKYSWQGLDECFPCSQAGPMLDYWIPSPYNPRHPYPTVSRPWIFSGMFTAEAADETAGGEWLSKCAEAHLVHIRTSLDFLRRARVVADREVLAEGGKTLVRYLRHRPLVSPKAGAEREL